MRNEGERGKGGNHPNLNNQHINQQAVTRHGSLAGKGVGTGQAPKAASGPQGASHFWCLTPFPKLT